MKIDCNITENYLIEKNRMISVGLLELKKGREGSVLKKCCECNEIEKKAPDKAIAIVQQWSDEHPQKTYKEDFFEKLPSAEKGVRGYPRIGCPCRIYPQLSSMCNDSIYCSDCWDKMMEE